MIAARLAAPRRAALLTTLVLSAAVLRTILLPLGDLLSTLAFAACLLALTVFQSRHPAARPEGAGKGSATKAQGKGMAAGISLAAGLIVGLVLLVPVIAGPFGGRPLEAFWSWAALAALLATLEETAIRGVLYRHWESEAGSAVAIGIGAAVFALIHLTRYGAGAMPLDFAVGLALGGLRAFTGRVLPCAVAHTIADWGAWFWA